MSAEDEMRASYYEEEAMHEQRRAEGAPAYSKNTPTLADALYATADALDQCSTLAERAQYALASHYVFMPSTSTPAELADIMRVLRHNGFTVTKNYRNTTFEIVAERPTGEYSTYRITVAIDRDVVCTAKVVGQEEKEVVEVDQEMAAAARKTVKKMVDVVEWDCHPLLATPYD